MKFGPILLIAWLSTSNIYYASLSSGDAYSDPQLTPNFSALGLNFCVPTCFHLRIPKSCLSVHTREKKSPYLHQYQSYSSNNIYT